jgi:hypothetical protein
MLVVFVHQEVVGSPTIVHFIVYERVLQLRHLYRVLNYFCELVVGRGFIDYAKHFVLFLLLLSLENAEHCLRLDLLLQI